MGEIPGEKKPSSNGSGRPEAEWDLDVAVYPPPGKRVFDGAREGSVALLQGEYTRNTQAKRKDSSRKYVNKARR